jgi:hypothetical protein
VLSTLSHSIGYLQVSVWNLSCIFWFSFSKLEKKKNTAMYQDTISLQEYLHNHVDKIIVNGHMGCEGTLGLI